MYLNVIFEVTRSKIGGSQKVQILIFAPYIIIENYRTLYLVGGFEHFLFFHILGMSSSQLTNSYFSEG